MTGDGQNPPNAAYDEVLAEFLCRVQAEIVDEAKKRLLDQRVADFSDSWKNLRVTLEEATEVKQEEFAQRAARRFEEGASGCVKALPSTMDGELEEILK